MRNDLRRHVPDPLPFDGVRRATVHAPGTYPLLDDLDVFLLGIVRRGDASRRDDRGREESKERTRRHSP
jgi:hypothetical protein